MKSNRAKARRTAEWEQADRLAAAGQLAGGVVHEARNLMTAIVSFAQVGRTSRECSDHAERFARIELESRRCLDMLTGFLELVRSGLHNLTEAATDVNEVIESAASLLRSSLRLRQLSLDVELAESLPMVRSNPHSLRQVIVNLLTNAMHASPANGRIIVTSSAVGDEVRIIVRDSGPGIPEELREQVFEPLFTTKPAGEGTGLGLAVCRNLVQRWGGTVHVDRETAGGAAMVVSLWAQDRSGRG